ncbi:MAG: hypothetical protein IT208_11350 [Chthonomonadales bacterium]|nr:hypothetical protein [Chthonomonadales bacterium]
MHLRISGWRHWTIFTVVTALLVPVAALGGHLIGSALLGRRPESVAWLRENICYMLLVTVPIIVGGRMALEAWWRRGSR